MNQLVTHVFNLVIQLLIAFLVWQHYRDRTYPETMKYRSFWPRFWTGSVDACVLWPVSFGGAVILSFKLPAAVIAVVIVAQNLGVLFYSVIMHARFGQTFGKMATKVRVVDAITEGPLTFRQALLRESLPLATTVGILGYVIYALLTAPDASDPQRALAQEVMVSPKTLGFLAILPGLWYLAEVLTMLTNDKRRALHDFIAGTVVIRTNAA